MIRRGKADGWLTLQPNVFQSWAETNGVTFHGIEPVFLDGRGSGLVVSEDSLASEHGSGCLLTVPENLILSLEQVAKQASVDVNFKEVLESLGEFGRTSRGAILCFLLFQVTTVCPDLSQPVGVQSKFITYIKSLPSELLPTFWTPDELKLLMGTSLAPATSAKLASLSREYGQLCACSIDTQWYAAVRDHLDFDDWLQVDSMYRSRALEFPGIGDCMVPCVDLANHAVEDETIAIFERDDDGNAVLLLREGKSLSEGKEITISYGDEKGACEMLFSYGFLPAGIQSAGAVFLSLAIPPDDEMRSDKLAIANCAPGLKLTEAGDGSLDWVGDFIWLLAITEDDPLHFEQDERGVSGYFDDHRLTDGAAELHNLLLQSELWNLYHARALTILQQRIYYQIQMLSGSGDGVESTSHGLGTSVRVRTYNLALTLRKLEYDLLERTAEHFEQQKVKLMESDVVKAYIADPGSDEN